LRSRFARRDEYIERVCTDLCRMTKKTATMPITATNGPTKKSGDIVGPIMGDCLTEVRPHLAEVLSM
jgi:hypothetical protein